MFRRMDREVANRAALWLSRAAVLASFVFIGIRILDIPIGTATPANARSTRVASEPGAPSPSIAADSSVPPGSDQPISLLPPASTAALRRSPDLATGTPSTATSQTSSYSQEAQPVIKSILGPVAGVLAGNGPAPSSNPLAVIPPVWGATPVSPAIGPGSTTLAAPPPAATTSPAVSASPASPPPTSPRLSSPP